MGKDIPSPWQPMQNKVDLAILGKLQEELGELQAIAARCIIQGIEEAEPETHKINRYALTEEISDVEAAINVAIDRFNLSHTVLVERHRKKIEHFRRWHSMLEDK